MKTISCLIAMAFGSCIAAVPAISAQVQVVVPQPEAPFTGKMSADSRQSTEAWPKQTTATKKAPNVLLILVDDAGFSASSTFGGPVLTPNYDKLAVSGLRYNEFHVNAICAPSRASLLSGRTDHQIGFGTITEFAAGYPGYNSIWPANSASVAEVLKDNGYNTAAFGKWHNTPVWEITPAGPFDRWPTGLGFEYFYGFLSAFDNQYYPRLYRNTTPVEPSKTPEEGYSLTTDLADDAITWLHRHDAAAPDKPFFLYFATAATHTPHQVPKQWIDQYKGKFDQGWDVLRKQNFEREKQLGVIPANARDNPRPAGLPAWDSLPPAQKKLLAHQAEVYAGFGTQADYEIGRLIQAVHDEGQADNTLIIEIYGDNGGSAEDGPTGYDARTVKGVADTVQNRVQKEDGLGSEVYMNASAAAWAWALSAPFPGTKADASHLGGTRDPMVISWPAHIKTPGLRSQFTHLDDIAPTVYEAAGIKPPTVVKGVRQTPLYGTSFLYTFDHAQEPSRHHVQVFETNGNKAIYKDGWWAGQLLRSSWDRIGSPGYSAKQLLDGNTHPWELYNLNEDYSQSNDLATKYPQKLAQMKALFDAEARRTNIYPLLPLRGLIDRPTPEKKKLFTYRSGVDRLQDVANVPLGGGIPYTVTADVVIPEHQAEGVLIAQGGRYGGSSLFIRNNRVVYEVNVFGNRSGQLVAAGELHPGTAHIVLDMTPDMVAGAEATNGDAENAARKPISYTGHLTVNGTPQGEAHFINVPKTGGYWSGAETLDIGSDLGSAASSEYNSPNRFTGKIDKITIELK
jgi:arylsulfatase A-like enzyme